jgi:hypothetical protein
VGPLVGRPVVDRIRSELRLINYDRKVGTVSRYSFYLRFTMIVAILGAAAVFLGTDPWGPW